MLNDNRFKTGVIVQQRHSITHPGLCLSAHQLTQSPIRLHLSLHLPIDVSKIFQWLDSRIMNITLLVQCVGQLPLAWMKGNGLHVWFTLRVQLKRNTKTGDLIRTAWIGTCSNQFTDLYPLTSLTTTGGYITLSTENVYSAGIFHDIPS